MSRVNLKHQRTNQTTPARHHSGKAAALAAGLVAAVIWLAAAADQSEPAGATELNPHGLADSSNGTDHTLSALIPKAATPSMFGNSASDTDGGCHESPTDDSLGIEDTRTIDYDERQDRLVAGGEVDEPSQLAEAPIIEPDFDDEPESENDSLALKDNPLSAPALSAAQARSPSQWDTVAPLPVKGLFPELHPALFKEVDGRIVQELDNGQLALTTLDPSLQRAAAATISPFPIPYAAIVAMEPATGRVLAMVSQSDEEPDGWNLPLRPAAPSASVFKIITVAALLEHGALNPNDQFCYHGGLRRLTERNIVGCPRRDNKCNDMGIIISNSANSMAAKLAYYNLDSQSLLAYAENFGFNRPIPFEMPIQPSLADIPVDDNIEMARSAAGFWHSELSAVHGAMLAAAIANQGVMMQPILVDQVVNQAGAVSFASEPAIFSQPVKAETAAILTEMMKKTVSEGTARRTFSRWPRSWNISVAGKTGSLTRTSPDFLDYSWFVAFAPADAPEIAVAAMVANRELWHVRAPVVVRQVLHSYFKNRPQATVTQQQKKSPDSPQKS